MPTMIRYQHVYEMAVHAVDLASLKPITNLLYLKNGDQSAGPIPAYGDFLIGSDMTTVINAFRTAWKARVCTLLNVNYQVNNYLMRDIVGWKYKAPPIRIAGMGFGVGTTTITTASAHGLASGDTVVIAGVGTPAVVNTSWPVVVTGAFTFTIMYGGGTTWSGDGTVTPLAGKQLFLYGDQAIVTVPAGTDLGTITGDALPLASTMSVRRIANRAGKNFRSGFRLSPLPEDGWMNGTMTSATQTLAVNNLHAFFIASVPNGNTDVGAGNMNDQAVSKQKAFLQATPFTSSSAWSSDLSDIVPQFNNGSLTRRKPRLTASITHT